MSDRNLSSWMAPLTSPERSVVVEACAGSGKTWLLASRIVGLLLNGAPPGDILAITFTRKAAREIEARVVGWLRLLALGEDRQVADFLAERGLMTTAGPLRDARGLYERVLSAQPGLTVKTFHAWFLQLMAAAPISSGLAGCTLVEPDSRLFDELWRSFVSGFPKEPDNAAAQAILRLLEYGDYDSIRSMIWRAMARRGEWLAYGGGEADIGGKVVANLRALSGEDGTTPSALADFFSGDWMPEFQAYLDFLEQNATKPDLTAAQKLRAAFAATDAEKRFDYLYSILFTQEDAPRRRKPSEALTKRLGKKNAEAFIECHYRLAERLGDCAERRLAGRVLAFNRDACAVFAAFLEHADAYKQARLAVDFADAEWHVLRLLRDEDSAAFLQARMDARYRHVLLDEFQDTNPIQWQILLAWLSAYSDGARPTVFLVGDPKQSIYRFRGAEPRLFSTASEFLEREYGAARYDRDTTRRNAPPIVDLVNAIFLDLPEFMPFRRQDSLAGALAGRVELLPLCQKNDKPPVRPDDPAARLRNPLTDPENEPTDTRYEQEAEALVEKIGEIVGNGGEAWKIADKTADGQTIERAADYGDIMLLVRSRSHLSTYEHALASAGIPFEADARGGLLTALEVTDCVALLEFLVVPADNLKLAHLLKSPFFSCDDEDMMSLAARQEPAWRERLFLASLDEGASPSLKRAARLIEQWQGIADTLPSHDLLDRIFFEGEVVARYRASVPAAAAPLVEANLRALIILAIELDAGRYPSLPRFIDALREWRDADVNDAPSEGEIDDDGNRRVRILTIHGAKGLEAPIVWLLGANDGARRRASGFDVIVDWPPDSASPGHFSFYARAAKSGRFRQPFFESERAAENREELNLLYVAITRARQVFIASGVEHPEQKGSDETPYRRIERAIAALGGNRTYGDALPRVSAKRACDPLPPHDAPRPDFPPPVGLCRPDETDARRHGVLFHALIETRLDGGATNPSTPEDNETAGDPVRAAVERLLGNPAFAPFFDPSRYRKAWNEIELTDSEGRLMRIDRLVDCGDTVWVLDYKSSSSASERLPEYREQVSRYCQAVAAIFPLKSVRGALLFADMNCVEIPHPPEEETGG